MNVLVYIQYVTNQFCATQEISIIPHIASVCMKQDAHDKSSCSNFTNRSEIQRQEIWYMLRLPPCQVEFWINVSTCKEINSQQRQISVNIFRYQYFSLFYVKHTFTLTHTSNFCKQKFKWSENKMMISSLLHITVSSAEITVSNEIWYTVTNRSERMP